MYSAAKSASDDRIAEFCSPLAHRIVLLLNTFKQKPKTSLFRQQLISSDVAVTLL